MLKSGGCRCRCCCYPSSSNNNNLGSLESLASDLPSRLPPHMLPPAWLSKPHGSALAVRSERV